MGQRQSRPSYRRCGDSKTHDGQDIWRVSCALFDAPVLDEPERDTCFHVIILNFTKVSFRRESATSSASIEQPALKHFYACSSEISIMRCCPTSEFSHKSRQKIVFQFCSPNFVFGGGFKMRHGAHLALTFNDILPRNNSDMTTLGTARRLRLCCPVGSRETPQFRIPWLQSAFAPRVNPFSGVTFIRAQPLTALEVMT